LCFRSSRESKPEKNSNPTGRCHSAKSSRGLRQKSAVEEPVNYHRGGPVPVKCKTPQRAQVARVQILLYPRSRSFQFRPPRNRSKDKNPGRDAPPALAGAKFVVVGRG
jgi:hypothetical protein